MYRHDDGKVVQVIKGLSRGRLDKNGKEFVFLCRYINTYYSVMIMQLQVLHIQTERGANALYYEI